MSMVWYGNSLFDTTYKYTHLNILHNYYNIGQETTLRIQRVLAAMQPPKNKLFGTM